MQLSQNIQDAVTWFTHALIAGDLGPDDSRFSRDELFLKHPGNASQAMAVFLHRLEIGEAGEVLNHDEAEERARQYVSWKAYHTTPEPPFSNAELGIKSQSL